MKRSTRNRSRYVIGGFAAAVTAVGGLLVSGPAASADDPPLAAHNFALEANGVWQENVVNFAGLSQNSNSVDVTRGPNHSQFINDLAGCRKRAHVLNLVLLDQVGNVVRSYTLYDACVTKVTTPGGGSGTEEVDTIAYAQMTITGQPATS